MQLYKLGKLFVSLFIIYILWFYGAVGPQSILLYGLAALATAFLLLDAIRDYGLIKPRCLSWMSLLLTFGTISFVTGIIVSTDKDYFVSAMFTYFAYTIICYDVCYISEREGSMEWLLNVLLLVAILCSIQTIFFGEMVRSSTEYVTTMGVNNNPNSLGIVMVIGIFSALNNKKFESYFILYLLLSVVFLYVIVLCGSRKCLIAGLLLLLFWTIIYLKNQALRDLNLKMLMRIALIAIGVILVLAYFKNQFLNTSAFIRISRMFNDDAGNEERLNMYNQALNMWKEHPVFGIGYDQFRVVSDSQRMTHSTYAEILVDTGLLGCGIWLIYITKYIVSILDNTRILFSKVYKYRCLMLLLMLAIEFFIAIAQVWFFDFAHLILLTYLFGAMAFWDNEDFINV